MARQLILMDWGLFASYTSVSLSFSFPTLYSHFTFFQLMFDCLLIFYWNKNVLLYTSFVFFYWIDWIWTSLHSGVLVFWLYLQVHVGYSIAGLGFIISRAGGSFRSFSIFCISKRITNRFLRWAWIGAEARHGRRGFEAVNVHLTVMLLTQWTAVLTGRLSPWFSRNLKVTLF